MNLDIVVPERTTSEPPATSSMLAESDDNKRQVKPACDQVLQANFKDSLSAGSMVHCHSHILCSILLKILDLKDLCTLFKLFHFGSSLTTGRIGVVASLI